MKLYIKDTDETKTVSMRKWEGDSWGPDFFHDMEFMAKDESEITIEQYWVMVGYWADEVRIHNDGKYTEQFGDYDGSKIGFFAD